MSTVSPNMKHAKELIRIISEQLSRGVIYRDSDGNRLTKVEEVLLALTLGQTILIKE